MKKAFHCGDYWRVKNSEGKDSGALQHKTWKPGRLQLKNDEDNAVFLDNNKLEFGIQERWRLKEHDYVIMFYFYFGSLMQEH
jgi:hypothetical protein